MWGKPQRRGVWGLQQRVSHPGDDRCLTSPLPLTSPCSPAAFSLAQAPWDGTGAAGGSSGLSAQAAGIYAGACAPDGPSKHPPPAASLAGPHHPVVPLSGSGLGRNPRGEGWWRSITRRQTAGLQASNGKCGLAPASRGAAGKRRGSAFREELVWKRCLGIFGVLSGMSRRYVVWVGTVPKHAACCRFRSPAESFCSSRRSSQQCLSSCSGLVRVSPVAGAGGTPRPGSGTCQGTGTEGKEPAGWGWAAALGLCWGCRPAWLLLALFRH